MSRTIFGIGGGLLLLGVLAWGVGRSLPPDHSVTVVDTLAAAPDSTWDALTDVWAYPQWRPGVDAVEIIALDGRPAWREQGPSGEFTFEIVDVDPPHHMVTRLAGADLPVGGTWSWSLRPEGDGTIVEVREEGTIRSPIQRFLAHFVTGHADSMESYLEALAHRVGE